MSDDLKEFRQKIIKKALGYKSEFAEQELDEALKLAKIYKELTSIPQGLDVDEIAQGTSDKDIRKIIDNAGPG